MRGSGLNPESSILNPILFLLLTACCLMPTAFAQQPQAQAGQETFPVNAKFVQGFGPGYWPTAGSNLTLDLAPGTAVCSNIVQTYAGGTLTLAPSATNYVYLNPANNCVPASNTTGFTSASIPIATVVTSSAAISSITDVRTMFVSNGVTGSGTVTSVGMTGDGIIFSPTVSGSPITSGGTVVPQLLTQTANMVLAGPGSGLPATPTFRALASADLPGTISSNTTGKAATATALAATPTQCGANNWATGISTSGNANCSQPAFSNLAGSVTLGQTPLATAGDLLFANSTPALARLPIGGTNQFLGISGGLPAWIQPTFSSLSGTATVLQGGTGQTTAATAFNALSPLTTEGDLHYYHSSSNTRLAIGGASTFLTSNGTDPTWGSLTGAGFGSQTTNTILAAPNGSSGNPSFRALAAADLPASITSSTTGNAATATTLAAAPSQCTGSAFALGIAASGNANCIGSQTANYVYAAPNGSSGAPTFRAIVGSDLPTVAISGGGTGQTTTAAAFNALSPLSTEGDLHYYHSSSNARLGIGSNNQCLTSNGTDPVWGSCSTGTGTVTSVGLSMPSVFSVSGTPVTGSGTLTAALATQSANRILAGPSSGSAAAPTFRALVGADLPAPSGSTLGGVESVTCTAGQFLDQVSTTGVPACATPSGSAAGLGNGTTVVDASLQAGVDFCAKTNAAVALLASTGGTVDTSGMIGAQSCAENINAYTQAYAPYVQPLNIKFGAGLRLNLNGNRILTADGTNLIGPSPRNWAQTAGGAVIASNTSTDVVDINNFGYANQSMVGLEIVNSGTGTCVTSNGGAILVEGNAFYCRTGYSYTGSYARILDNLFELTDAGILMNGANNVNSAEIRDNVYMGAAGTAVVNLGGYSDKFEGGEDIENAGLAYFLAGEASEVHGPYTEGINPTKAWAPSTYYGIGAILLIQGTQGQALWAAVCTAAGTSGSSAPAWPNTQWATVNDGTLTWQVYESPSEYGWPWVVIAPGSATNIIDGVSGQIDVILDLNYTISRDTTNRIDMAGNRAWGSQANPPYLRVAQPGLGFAWGPNNDTVSGAYGSLNFSNWNIQGNGLPFYGPEFDFTSWQCAQYGQCGHMPLHVSTLAANMAAIDGALSVQALPNPNPPTVTPVTTGSTTYTYYVVANCPWGQTLPSAAATITNGNATPDNQIQLPTTYAGALGAEAWSSGYWACNWDILRGDTSHSVATGITPANGILVDEVATPSAYTPPTQNTTGSGYVAGNLTAGGSVKSNLVASTGGSKTQVSIADGAQTNTGWDFRSAGSTVSIDGYANGNALFALNQNGVQLSAGSAFAFSSGDATETAPDTGLSRGGSGVLLMGNGTAGDSSGTLQAAALTASGYIHSNTGFCITTNCTTSLLSNPMTTLGDVLYGGAGGAATRLAGNATTTPMYLKSLGVSGAATAPTLAQIQFSDIAGALGISAGGTGQTTAATAFDALSPLTSEGDLHYYHSSSNTRLAIGGASTFLISNGTDPSWGSLTGAGFGSQTTNTILAAPNGSSGNPSFRTLVSADLPTSIASNTTGNAATATTATTASSAPWSGLSSPATYPNGSLGLNTGGNTSSLFGYSSTTTFVTGGIYVSGATVTGSTGQSCNVSGFNGGGSGASALVHLTGSNTLASGAPLYFADGSMGIGYTSAPTSATLSNGSATCSGTISVITQVSGTPSTFQLAGMASVGYQPTPQLISATSAGAGSLAPGTYSWCATAMSDATSEPNFGQGGPPYLGQTPCSNIVTATITNSSVNGAQTISWVPLTGPDYNNGVGYGGLGTIACDEDLQMYRRFNGGAWQQIGFNSAALSWICMGINSMQPPQTQWVDDGTAPTYTLSPPTVDTSFQFACEPWQMGGPGAIPGQCIMDTSYLYLRSSIGSFMGGGIYTEVGPWQASGLLPLGIGNSVTQTAAGFDVSALTGPASGHQCGPGGSNCWDIYVPNSDSSLLVPKSSATSHEWVQYVDGTGVQHLSQPSYSDLAGTLGISAGGTGQTTAAAALNALSPLASEGDLLYYHSSANTRLGVGSNGQCLTSNGTDPLWGPCSAGSMTNPMTALGDLIYGGASGAGTRLGGNTSSTKSFLISTGSSGAATAPLWGTIATSDLPGSGAITINGQACTLGSTCNANNGAAQYSVAVNGAAGAALGGVSPSSTSGVPLISQGSSSNPVFGALNLAGGASVVTGTLAAASEPAHTGDTTNTAGALAMTTTGLHFGASNAVALPTSAPTSGGIPYFSSASAIASSAALTQYGVVVGGGAGGAPTSTAAGAANMPLIGNGSSSNPSFSTIAYPSSLTSGGILYASSTAAISGAPLITANALVKSGGAGTAPAASSITDNGTDVTTSEPVLAGNGVALTSATTITATSMTTTGLVLPTVPVSKTVRGRCDIIWQQATAVSTVTFGVGMNNAPTDLYVSPIIWTSTSGANVSPSPTTITGTTTTAVTSAITPGAFGTNYHGEFIFTLITGSSNAVAVTLYGDTQTTGDALVIEPGSSCGWLP
jgi:hypothetical protein